MKRTRELEWELCRHDRTVAGNCPLSCYPNTVPGVPVLTPAILTSYMVQRRLLPVGWFAGPQTQARNAYCASAHGRWLNVRWDRWGTRESLYPASDSHRYHHWAPETNFATQTCCCKALAMGAGHPPPIDGFAVLLTKSFGPQGPESYVAIIRYPTVFPDNYRTSTRNVFVEHKGCRVNLR